MVTGDDHINFAGAGFNRLLDLTDALRQRSLTCREACCNRRDWNVRATQRFDRILDAVGIHAHRADGHFLPIESESGDHILADGVSGLRTKTFDASGRVITGQGSQVNTSDGAQEPGRLPILFDSAPLGKRLDAPLDRALVDVRAHHPIQIKRGAGVAIIFGTHGNNLTFSDTKNADLTGISTTISHSEEEKNMRMKAMLKDIIQRLE